MTGPYDRVRETCRQAVADAHHVKIDDEAITTFAASIQKEEISRTSKPFSVPLKFESIDQEMNFWAMVHLLNFGSGFRHQLHEDTGKGAFESLLFGLMSLFIQGNTLDVTGLESVNAHIISEAFGFEIAKEQAVSPGLFEYVPSTLRVHADHIVQVMHDTARRLREMGCKRISQVWKVARPATSDTDCAAPMAAPLIDALIAAFPAFDDRAVVNGKDVYLYKKVQLLCADFARRFGPADPLRFSFRDLAAFTVFSDNVLPAVLRTVNVLHVAPETLARIEANVPLPAGGSEQVELRAATVVACEKIRARMNGVLASDLDTYLWRLGKKGNFRQIEPKAKPTEQQNLGK